jgi:hypothetical protein
VTKKVLFLDGPLKGEILAVDVSHQAVSVAEDFVNGGSRILTFFIRKIAIFNRVLYVAAATEDQDTLDALAWDLLTSDLAKEIQAASP